MKKAYQIWNTNSNENSGTGYLVPAEEIEDMIETFSFSLYKLRDPRITADNAAAYCEAINRDFDESDFDNVRDFLESEKIEFDLADETYTAADDFIVGYNTIDKMFSDSKYGTVPVYTWWDGSNFRQMSVGEDDDVVEFNYDPDAEVCLDTWNGSNYQSGGVGLHSYYAVLDDGSYLMVYRSQWQGDHTMAEIISEINFRYVAGKNYLA